LKGLMRQTTFPIETPSKSEWILNEKNQRNSMVEFQ
jgi:hypothetical protein